MMCTCLVKLCASAAVTPQASVAEASSPASVARRVGMSVSPKLWLWRTVAPGPEGCQTLVLVSLHGGISATLEGHGQLKRAAMPIESKYVFIASMDVDADKEEIFNEVYDNEHVPNLLQVPGVHAVTRLK